LYFIASQNPNSVFAHFACHCCDDLMAIFQLNPKRRVRQELLYDTGKFEWFFLRHGLSFKKAWPDAKRASK
jgi:hypothetical protein